MIETGLRNLARVNGDRMEHHIFLNYAINRIDYSTIVTNCVINVLLQSPMVLF